MDPTITAFERSPDGGKGLARDMRVRWALDRPIRVGVYRAPYHPSWTQMTNQKPLHRLIEVESVLFVLESMALVVLDHVLDLHAAFTQRIDDLIALGLVHPRWVTLSDSRTLVS